MTQDNQKEIFPIVDENGNVVGSATRAECHSGSKLLHPVVHLHVFDPQGRLYLQKRPDWKDIQPGKWDTAVGGHVDFGEEIIDALKREAREELCIELHDPQMLARYIFESPQERELIHAFKTVTHTTPTPTTELAGGRFWTPAEIAAHLGTNTFTPNFESEYKKLFLEE